MVQHLHRDFVVLYKLYRILMVWYNTYTEILWCCAKCAKYFYGVVGLWCCGVVQDVQNTNGVVGLQAAASSAQRATGRKSGN